MTLPSAANNLLRRTQRKILIMIVVSVAAILTHSLLAHFSYQKALDTNTQLQEKLSLTLSSAGLISAQKLIADNQEASDVLLNLFPTVVTFPEVIAELESLISFFDPNGLVQTPTNNPVKVSSELSIPINLIFTSTSTEISDLLIQLEQLPYIIEVISVESHSPNGHREMVNSKIGVRVYVQDPFTKNNSN